MLSLTTSPYSCENKKHSQVIIIIAFLTFLILALFVYDIVAILHYHLNNDSINEDASGECIKLTNKLKSHIIMRIITVI